MESVRKVGEQLQSYNPTSIVLNAGVVRSALLEDMDVADLEFLCDLFLTSSILLTQACLPFMKHSGFGRIIFIASRAAIGLATRTAYTATKSGQIGMARTWALELGPYGITVNVISPGPIQTKMFTDVVPVGSDRESALIETLPMRKLGQPDDIARATMFFADEDNNFVTGQNLFVCGGSSVGFLSI